MIEVEVHNTYSFIQGTLSKLCLDQLRFVTSYSVPGNYFSRAYKSGHWDGRRHMFNLRDQSFPTGLLHKVRSILIQNNLQFKVIDCRVKPPVALSFLWDSDIKLRDYQSQAIELAPKKQRGIVRIATGGGKSYVAAGIINEIKVPTLILIHKRDIFWQLIESLEKSLGVPIGKIGAGYVEPRSLTVGMIQTVARAFDPKIKVDKEDRDTKVLNPELLRKAIQSFQCIITDETHHLASDQYELVLSKCDQAFYRFGLTATDFRTDNADILIEAFTAPKFVDISASSLIGQGCLAAPTIYMYKFSQDKQPSGSTYHDVYSACIEQNCRRNDVVVEICKKALKANKTILVAINRVEHGKILENLLKVVEKSTFFAHGSVDSKVRKQVLEDLNEGKRKIVISTTCFGEGVNVPNLSVLVNAKAADSAVDAMQLAGRCLRVTDTKKTATIIDLADYGCKYLTSHTKNRIEIYKTEPKFKVVDVDSINEIIF